MDKDDLGSSKTGLTGELPKDPHGQKRGAGEPHLHRSELHGTMRTSLPSFDLLW